MSTKATPQEPLTLSVTEAGSLLGVGKDAAYQAVRNGEIPVLRIGRLLRVPKVALEKLLSCESSMNPAEVDG